MKITSEIMQAEIDQKLPPYYETRGARIAYITAAKFEGLWFSMQFEYPGSGPKYVWVSVKEDMTSEEIETWSTDAAIQIKTAQQIAELEEKADQLDRA
jgi:hypothetical protein